VVNVGPLTAEIDSGVWGTPADFNGFRVLASLLHRHRSMEGNQTLQCLAVFWAGTLYIHYSELLPTVRIFPGAKFTLRPKSCVLLYLQRYCTALEQWAPAKLCGVQQRAPPILDRAAIRWASAHILVCVIIEISGDTSVKLFI